MNIGSAVHVQEQEELSPGLQAEQHDVPPLPTNRRKKDICGCFTHCCLSVVFLGLVCCSLLSLSLFAIGDHYINKVHTFENSTSGCVLHASKSDSSSIPQLGEVWWCEFVVWTMATVAIISAVMFFVSLGCTACSLLLEISAYVVI